MANPGAPGVVYATSDPAVNHIVFVIGTNVTAGLAPANLVPPDRAADATGTLVYIDLTPLGMAAGDLATLKVTNPAWAMATYATDADYIALTPTAPLTLSPDGPVSIPIAGLAMAHPPDPGTRQLSVPTYRVTGVTEENEPLTGTLGVTLAAPPGGHRNLHDDVTLTVHPVSVITSCDGEHPAVNTVSLVLTSTSDTTIPRGDTTEMVLGFLYADPPGYGALATVAQAIGFRVRQKAGATNWTVNQGADQESPSWLLLPPPGVPVHDGYGIVAEFDVADIVTTLRPGATVLILAYRGVPGYDDGAFVATMEKLPQVAVTAFDVAPNPAVLVRGQAAVTVTWKTANASSATLYAPDGIRAVDVNGTRQATISHRVSFSLQAAGDGGPANTARATVDAGVFLAGEVAYVSSLDAQEITPIGLDSLLAGPGIPVGQGSQSITLDPTGRVAYVCGQESVVAVDLVTKAVGQSKGLLQPAMGISPDGSFAVVLENAFLSGHVMKWKLPELQQLWKVPASGALYSAAVSPDGAKAYVASPKENAVMVYGVSGGDDGHLLTRINIDYPVLVTVTPDGSQILVVTGNGSVVPVTIATDQPGPAIVVPGTSTLSAIAVTPDGSRAYVTDLYGCMFSARVFPIELATGTVGDPILIGSRGLTPQGIVMAYNAAGSLVALVANRDVSTVTPFTVPDHTVLPAIKVGGHPIGLAIRFRQPDAGAAGSPGPLAAPR